MREEIYSKSNVNIFSGKYIMTSFIPYRIDTNIDDTDFRCLACYKPTSYLLNPDNFSNSDSSAFQFCRG